VSRTIARYAVYFDEGRQGQVLMPRGARVVSAELHFEEHESTVYLNALVDPSAPLVMRCLWAFAAGDAVPTLDEALGELAGVIQPTSAGPTFHIFDVGENPA